MMTKGQKLYRQRKEAGLCPQCGGPRDTQFVCCSICLKKKRDGKARRVAEGRCSNCGAPRDTEHPYLCERCFVVEHGRPVRVPSKVRPTSAPRVITVHQPTTRQ